MTGPTSDGAGARLTVDLAAIRRNFRILVDAVADHVRVAAVVKADAYGLGAGRVAPALAIAGCRHFFVATLDEALSLRNLLPDAKIYALNGTLPGAEPEFAANDLVPVLNDLGAVERWQEQARRAGRRLRAVLHVDTGMSRLGLTEAHYRRLTDDPEGLSHLAPSLLMSHLACAEERGHLMNHVQREQLLTCASSLPATPLSLANSSGIFLGRDFHYDLVRPGAALYGINPTPDLPNPMSHVARLQGKIVAVRDVDSPTTVGYGATYRLERKSRIATIAIGYADGVPRILGNRATAFLADGAAGDIPLPVVGRISMDLTTLDVSDLRPDQACIGNYVDLIGPLRSVDDVASEAGTIAYEILAGIGQRVARTYSDEKAEA